jgi:predicted secreted acid phosphatase
MPPTDPPYSTAVGLEYAETQTYKDEFEQAIQSALVAAKKHLKTPKRAVVSDLDETLFDNREFDREYPVFRRDLWNEWVEKESAPLHSLTAKFLAWARDNGFAVFLVTTRSEEQRKSTIGNLVKKGVAYDGLYMRPVGNVQSHEKLKSHFRKEIQDMGFKVAVNVGDQWSDLAGGFAEDCEKIPNKMYFKR